MKQIIFSIDDKDSRISTDELEDIASSVINYLCHDFQEYFETNIKFDEDDNEIELPAIKINYNILIQVKDIK